MPEMGFYLFKYYMIYTFEFLYCKKTMIAKKRFLQSFSPLLKTGKRANPNIIKTWGKQTRKNAGE